MWVFWRMVDALRPSRIRRSVRFFWQRMVRGWDDSDTWNLDAVIARFTHRRLIRFKELNNGYPDNFTEEEWDDCIDDMIYAMSVIGTDLNWDLNDAVDWERVNRGTEYFGKHFRDLWW